MKRRAIQPHDIVIVIGCADGRPRPVRVGGQRVRSEVAVHDIRRVVIVPAMRVLRSKAPEERHHGREQQPGCQTLDAGQGAIIAVADTEGQTDAGGTAAASSVQKCMK